MTGYHVICLVIYTVYIYWIVCLLLINSIDFSKIEHTFTHRLIICCLVCLSFCCRRRSFSFVFIWSKNERKRSGVCFVSQETRGKDAKGRKKKMKKYSLSNSREPNVCSQSDGTVSKVCGLKAVYNDPTFVSLSHCLYRDLLFWVKRVREERQRREKGVRRR